MLGGRATLELASRVSDTNDYTLLHYAAESDAVDIFRYCFRLFKPSDYDRPAQSPVASPLHVTTFFHSYRCFEFLYELNLDARLNGRPLPIDFNASFRGDSPLLYILKAASYEMIPLAVRAGAEVDRPTRDEWPVIAHAVRLGSLEGVGILCTLGANVNWVSKEGWSLVHIAAQERNPEMCTFLCERGASPVAISLRKVSPFMLANKHHRKDERGETARTLRQLIVKYYARKLMLDFGEMRDHAFDANANLLPATP
jgi:ankyrin repeat protein